MQAEGAPRGPPRQWDLCRIARRAFAYRRMAGAQEAQ